MLNNGDTYNKYCNLKIYFKQDKTYSLKR